MYFDGHSRHENDRNDKLLYHQTLISACSRISNERQSTRANSAESLNIIPSKAEISDLNNKIRLNFNHSILFGILSW